MIEPIIHSYRADISDHKAKLKELSGEQKKQAQEHLNALEKQNAAIENHIKTIAKIGVAVGVLAAAAKFAWGAMKDAADHARLSSATAGVDIEKLRKATFGLKSDMELLRIAARLNTSEFKLTSDEMGKSELAIRALQNRGVELGKATDIVTKAMIEMKLDGLHQLGIGLDVTQGKLETAAQRTDQFGKNMTVVDKLAAEASKTGLLAGESWQQAAIQAEDAWANFKRELVDTINIEKTAAELRRRGHLGDVDYYDVNAMKKRYELLSSGYDEDKTANAVLVNDALVKMSQSLLRDALIEQDRFRKSMLNAYSGGQVVTPSGGGKRAPATMPGYTMGDTVYGSTSGGLGEMAPVSGVTDEMFHSALSGAQTERWKAELEMYRAQGQASLENIFGPIEEINGYREAFEALSAAMTAGFGAWIDGSKSVGQAFKQMLGDGLKATAMEMWGQGIKHAAYAIGSAAFGRWDQAAMHAKAAAMHAAGALAIGAVAKATLSGSGGGGGGGGGGESMSAPSNYGASSPAPSGESRDWKDALRNRPAPTSKTEIEARDVPMGRVVVVYGDAFANDSPLMRQRQAELLVEQAIGSHGVY